MDKDINKDMNKHPFDLLALDNGANIIFTPCPGSKAANIEESIKQLKEAGTSILVTLMFTDEMLENKLNHLLEVCTAQGIHWIQLPIIDDEAPNHVFETEWAKHIPDMLEALNNQVTIAVHCKGGTGRTGMVIALILLHLGWTSEKVIEKVKKIRPKALVNTEQLAYFHKVVGDLNKV